MNLFDFTYCANSNRQIQNLARISPEKWSFGQSGEMCIRDSLTHGESMLTQKAFTLQ